MIKTAYNTHIYIHTAHAHKIQAYTQQYTYYACTIHSAMHQCIYTMHTPILHSVLSFVLFAVYLDGLLSELVECGVGCYWKNLFAGCLCYADYIVLLAPCPSALRIMWNICCKYVSRHGLEFNTAKSQLIRFRHSARQDNNTAIYMNGHRLHFVDKVSHLGHILTFNLHDN